MNLSILATSHQISGGFLLEPCHPPPRCLSEFERRQRLVYLRVVECLRHNGSHNLESILNSIVVKFSNSHGNSFQAPVLDLATDTYVSSYYMLNLVVSRTSDAFSPLSS